MSEKLDLDINYFSKKRIFGYAYIAASSMAIALFGFLVWGHHMFTAESEFAALVFSLLTLALISLR